MKRFHCWHGGVYRGREKAHKHLEHKQFSPILSSRYPDESVHSKVLEGHHPRGTILREALRGILPLKGVLLSEASPGVSARVLRGSAGWVLRGSVGFSEGSGPMLVTLGNCLSLCSLSSAQSPDKIAYVYVPFPFLRAVSLLLNRRQRRHRLVTPIRTPQAARSSCI